VLPDGNCDISVGELEALRMGDWAALAQAECQKPSAMPFPKPDERWGDAISMRYRAEMNRLQTRLNKLDARLAREAAEKRLGRNIEKLRQTLFPFSKPQERVLPGLYWLRDAVLLDAIEKAMEGRAGIHLVKPSPP
jgi:hypothetical protein